MSPWPFQGPPLVKWKWIGVMEAPGMGECESSSRPADNRNSCRLITHPLAPFLLDSVPDLCGDVGAIESRDRPNAGRRRHIDFSEIAVDDVDTDKQKPAFLQFGA